MGWIDVLWPMVGSASLTLGLIYLLVWFRQPAQVGYLLFFATAVCVAAISIFELRMLGATDPAEYSVVLRWFHVPVFVWFVSITGFVRVYFRPDRMWLGYSACAVRAVSLVLNFTTGVNVNFESVTEMVAVPILGGEISYAPVGVTNKFAAVAHLSNLLLIAAVVDASIGMWRRGELAGRRRAVVVGGSMVLCFLAAAVAALLLNLGLVKMPTIVAVAFLGIALAMAYELGWEVLSAARLAAQLRISEENLRESEQRLQLAAGAGELGLWQWDAARDEVWATQEGRAMFGFTRSERIDRVAFLERVHPEDRPAIEHALVTSLTRGGPEFDQEYRILRPDGELRWMASRGRVERDVGGAAVLMRGVTQDITARRQAEERFRTLVEAAPSAIFVVDGDGSIVLVNARAETMLGYAREELIGRPVEILIPARFRDSHGTLVQAYRQEFRARAIGVGRELFAVRKNGLEFPVEIGLNPMQTSEGRFVLASVVDISGRKQAEREAARRRDEMAHLARVAMLGELSGALAHELNQPLSAILSNAQAAQRFLAQNPPRLDQVTEILADIVKADKRAGEVIKRLRSLLRKDEAQHRHLDVNEVVQEVLAVMRSDLLNRQMRVRTELAAQLPVVSGDRIQLQQVLLNLLMNGCDAMAGDEAARELSVRSEAADGGVHVSVVDRGTGIAPEDLERIFEPFVTTKAQGLGLGLAVCRSIVKAHGGRLWASNNPEGGATLHLQLPIA